MLITLHDMPSANLVNPSMVLIEHSACVPVDRHPGEI